MNLCQIIIWTDKFLVEKWWVTWRDPCLSRLDTTNLTLPWGECIGAVTINGLKVTAFSPSRVALSQIPIPFKHVMKITCFKICVNGVDYSLLLNINRVSFWLSVIRITQDHFSFVNWLESVGIIDHGFTHSKKNFRYNMFSLSSVLRGQIYRVPKGSS